LEDIKEAIYFGIKIIGENYVQEASGKYKILNQLFKHEKIEFHLIGHLQSNKVQEAIKIFDCIESLDSEKLAIKINKECKKLNRVIEVMIEINFNEENKSGISLENLDLLIKKVKELTNLKLIGLMSIPHIGKEEICFKKMQELKEKYAFEELSMGMSEDYSIAIKNGSTIIRLGKILFGEH
jgi:pyridoxal phosphate enzyme (YggS family)